MKGTVCTVVWGMGGPKYTVTGLSEPEARELAATVRAWGAVILRRDGDGPLRSIRYGTDWHDQAADQLPTN